MDEPNELGEWRTYNFKDGIERTHQVPSLRAQFQKRHEIVNKSCLLLFCNCLKINY